MPTIQSDERKKHVLALIVQLHVEHAAPVSSQAVAQHFDTVVSSATIRNIMAELEAEELIMHPHTSAGRVPTDRGYRMYVDSLMRVTPLMPEDKARTDEVFRRPHYRVRELLDGVSHVLADVSGHVAVGVAPDVRHGVLQQFDLIPMAGRHFLGVLRIAGGFVHSLVLDIDEELGAEELHHLVRFINAELVGIALDELDNFFTRRLLERQDAFFYVLRRAQHILVRSLVDMVERRMYYDGLGQLLNQPEFRNDVRQMQALVQILEQPDGLVDFMDELPQEPGMHITIGHEHANEGLTHCSVVSAAYGIDGLVLGRIAVLGPTRMPYAHVTAWVRYMSERVSRCLAGVGREA
jgi:heat-inducible transcriptional repressor